MALSGAARDGRVHSLVSSLCDLFVVLMNALVMFPAVLVGSQRMQSVLLAATRTTLMRAVRSGTRDKEDKRRESRLGAMLLSAGTDSNDQYHDIQ